MSNLNDVQAFATSNGSMPNNPQVYTNSFTIPSNANYVLDLKPLINSKRISNIQGIFIDNSQNFSNLYITTSASARISIPKNSQAIIPIYMSADNVLTFYSPTSSFIGYTLLNFPTPLAIWSTQSALDQMSFDGGGALQVDIAGIGGIAFAGSFIPVGGVTNYDSPTPFRAGIPYVVSTSATGNTTIIPASASNVFITGIDVVLRPDSQITAGGLFTVSASFTNGPSGGLNKTVFSRTINFAAATNYGDYRFFHADGLNIEGTGTDEFHITLSTALNAGAVECTVLGGYTSL